MCVSPTDRHTEQGGRPPTMSVQEALRPGVEQRTGRRRFVGGIVLGLAILQALWIVTVPPFRASDEFDHAYRAAAVARGQWQATEAGGDGRGTLVRVPADLVAAAHDQCAACPYTGPDNCSPAERSTTARCSSAREPASTTRSTTGWSGPRPPLPRCRGALRHAGRLGAALPDLHGAGRLGASDATAQRLVGRGSAAGDHTVFVYSTAVAAPNGSGDGRGAGPVVPAA